MRLTIGTGGEGLQLDQPPYNTEGLTARVLGNKGAGKSNTMAVMAESMHDNRIPFVYYDPNGDCLSLAELGPDVVTVGRPDHPDAQRQADYPLNALAGDPAGFAQMVLGDGYSLAIDLSAAVEEVALETAANLLRVHYYMAVKDRQPVGVFVDEAQTLAPQMGAEDIQKETRKILRRISFDGRKRGMMLTVATQRVTYLDKSLVFGCNVRIFGKLTYFPDYDQVKHYLPASFDQMRQMRSGQVHLVTERAQGMIQIARRRTTDLGKTPAFKQQRQRRPNKQNLQLPKVRQLSLLPREE